MCNWCNPETGEPNRAQYDMGKEKFGITIEGNEIIVYRYVPRFNWHADMALELPIKYCPMCGDPIEEEDE